MKKAKAHNGMALNELDQASPAAFWARVDELLGTRTFRDVETATGINYYTLYSARERGSKPSAANAKKLADYLGVSSDWLMAAVGPREVEISDQDRLFWERYRALPEEERAAIRILVLRSGKDADKLE